VRSSCEWVKWAHRTQAAFLFTSPERHHGQVPGLAWRIDCCLSLLGVTSPGVSSGEPSPPCIAVIQIPGSRHADLHRTASKAVESPADSGDTGLSAIIVECTEHYL